MTDKEVRQITDEVERRIALVERRIALAVIEDNKRLAEMDIAAMIDEYPESTF
jgi:hypothetical protein